MYDKFMFTDTNENSHLANSHQIVFLSIKQKKNQQCCRMGKKVILYGITCGNINNGCNTRYEIKIGRKQKVHTL